MNSYMYKEVAFKEGIELYDSGESVYILKPTLNFITKAAETSI